MDMMPSFMISEPSAGNGLNHSLSTIPATSTEQPRNKGTNDRAKGHEEIATAGRVATANHKMLGSVGMRNTICCVRRVFVWGFPLWHDFVRSHDRKTSLNQANREKAFERPRKPQTKNSSRRRSPPDFFHV